MSRHQQCRNAVEWLLFFWPEGFMKTEAHRAARVACLEANEGKIEVEAARKAFMAEILATDPRDDFTPTASAAAKKRRDLL